MHPEAVDARSVRGPRTLSTRTAAFPTGVPTTPTFSISAPTSIRGSPTAPRTSSGESFADARRYPDDAFPQFRRAAAAYVGCDPDAVVPTAGGPAAIRLAIQTTVSSGDSVLVPFPSFGEYAREVRLQGAEPVFVAHEELLDAALDDHAMAIVCNPNNPTGEVADADALDRFAARCRDGGRRFSSTRRSSGSRTGPPLAGADGVVVARSLTKLFGLPGLRAGFAVATGDHRARLETARCPGRSGRPPPRPERTACVRRRSSTTREHGSSRSERACASASKRATRCSHPRLRSCWSTAGRRPPSTTCWSASTTTTHRHP